MCCYLNVQFQGQRVKKITQTGSLFFVTFIFVILNSVYQSYLEPIPISRGLRHGSVAPHLLGLWVRIPPDELMSVSCECCVLSSRGLCDRPIICPKETYREWCVCVCVSECNPEASKMRGPWLTRNVEPRNENKSYLCNSLCNSSASFHISLNSFPFFNFL